MSLHPSPSLFLPSSLNTSLKHRIHGYSKTCVKQPPKIGFREQLPLNVGQIYCRMLQGEHSAILSTFIKLPFVIKIFVLSIFEWPFYTGFTVSTNALTLCMLYNLSLNYNFLKKFFQEHNQSVKWFGSRSGLKFCLSWSESKLFAKIISRQQKSSLACKELMFLSKFMCKWSQLIRIHTFSVQHASTQ